MNITIIGTGKVGSALATGWMKAGHLVKFGVRDLQSYKGKRTGIDAEPIRHSVASADVIVVAAVPGAVHEIAKALGDVADKVIIDAMNSIGQKPDPFSNTTDALLTLTNCRDIVKGFNTTGFENIANPIYNSFGIDMFFAGDSTKGKAIGKQLAKDLGFSRVHDFGGNDKFILLEQLAMCWINLGKQINSRDIAITIVQRNTPVT